MESCMVLLLDKLGRNLRCRVKKHLRQGGGDLNLSCVMGFTRMDAAHGLSSMGVSILLGGTCGDFGDDVFCVSPSGGRMCHSGEKASMLVSCNFPCNLHVYFVFQHFCVAPGHPCLKFRPDWSSARTMQLCGERGSRPPTEACPTTRSHTCGGAAAQTQIISSAFPEGMHARTHVPACRHFCIPRSLCFPWSLCCPKVFCDSACLCCPRVPTYPIPT